MTDLTSGPRRRRAPGRQTISKVVKPSALRKARSVASFDARRNPCCATRDRFYSKIDIFIQVHGKPWPGVSAVENKC
jgi:hypothetical protein